MPTDAFSSASTLPTSPYVFLRYVFRLLRSWFVQYVVFFLFQKVKELTYMHSEGIMAGELKHGPLALVDASMPVMMIIMRDPVYNKCMNALQQVY